MFTCSAKQVKRLREVEPQDLQFESVTDKSADRELELEELADVIIDATTPLNRCND